MKKTILLSIVSLFTVTLTACQSTVPVKDGVCVPSSNAGLPMPIDPDCVSSASAK